MSEAQKEIAQDDFLNLPDDQIPDYPPEDNPVESPEASPEATEDTNTDEDINDEHNETESNEGNPEEDSGEEGSNNDESGDRGDTDSGDDDDTDNEDSEESNEEEGDPEQAQGEEDTNEEESAQQKVKPKGKKTKGKGKATELEATATSADAQLRELFAPFKANGRDMQVSSVDDAITLMKMGANYNKKMQGLKPNLRLMKMLENNKLLDEEKLSFLIDLQNQNPQAIAKLVKDSGFDPIDHGEDNTDYTPGTYTVNEKEVDLDMVLEDLKDTPSFQQTIDTISKKWDAASRKLVQDDPGIIRVINQHIDNGMYDKIMNIVQNEKSLNRLTEMSDLQAYKHVGDTLQASGAFAPQPEANEKKPPAKKLQDPKLNSRKKAAANTRSRPAKKQSGIDPLSLSDDDFAKLDPALM